MGRATGPSPMQTNSTPQPRTTGLFSRVWRRGAAASWSEARVGSGLDTRRGELTYVRIPLRLSGRRTDLNVLTRGHPDPKRGRPRWLARNGLHRTAARCRTAPD